MAVFRECAHCGFKRDVNDGAPSWRCPSCEKVYPEVKELNARAFEQRQAQKDKEVILTTETYAPDLKVKRRLGVVTAECVFGMNILRDAFSAVTDLTGGRSRSTQNGLRDARVTCLNELKHQARELRADAVIAIDLDYSEFTGGGFGGEKSMLFLVASGTAVTLDYGRPYEVDGETGLNPFKSNDTLP